MSTSSNIANNSAHNITPAVKTISTLPKETISIGQNQSEYVTIYNRDTTTANLIICLIGLFLSFGGLLTMIYTIIQSTKYEKTKATIISKRIFQDLAYGLENYTAEYEIKYKAKNELTAKVQSKENQYLENETITVSYSKKDPRVVYVGDLTSNLFLNIIALILFTIILLYFIVCFVRIEL